MNKKVLIGIVVAVVIVIIIIIFVFAKSGSKTIENTNQPTQKTEENLPPATSESVDASMAAIIEQLKPTCVDFLAGELSGNPDSDCPGFDNPVNTSLCFYCYATKKQSASLCEKIDSASALKATCEKATGSTIDKIINK